MIDLNNEVLEKILSKETAKTEDLKTILRAIYTRTMRLYEKYFQDVDALSNDVIDELKQYNEETRSLVKYYYLDIPQDICMRLDEFEKTYSDKLLGPAWRVCLSDLFEDFRKRRRGKESEETLKAEFAKQALEGFYSAMDYVFREGFGTDSQTAKHVINGLSELIFGKA